MLTVYKSIPFTKLFKHYCHCGLWRMNLSCSSSSSKESESAVKFRHNFHKDCEDGLNKQINLELHASYTYFCMCTCLGRPDVGLPGFAQFFAAASDEERHHAGMMSEFINSRGGTVRLGDVGAPAQGPFHDPTHAVRVSIELETTVLKGIEELHKLAGSHGDAHLSDYLETYFIPEGYEGISKLAKLLARLDRAGPGVGVVLLDLDLVRHPRNLHSKVKPTQDD